MNGPKTIGEITGKWAVLFQALMVVAGMAIPFLITFCSWVTLAIFDVKTDVAILKQRNEQQQEVFLRMEDKLEQMRKDLRRSDDEQ